jgi:hypothetical protein
MSSAQVQLAAPQVAYRRQINRNGLTQADLPPAAQSGQSPGTAPAAQREIRLQTKLPVGLAGDQYERKPMPSQAVMTMSDPVRRQAPEEDNCFRPDLADGVPK